MKTNNNLNFNHLFINEVKNMNGSPLQNLLTIEKSSGKSATEESNKLNDFASKQSFHKPFKFGKTKLHIKNMVSIRCIMVVKAVLENLGLHYISVELGTAEIVEKLSQQKQDRLKADLHMCGLELLEDKKNILVEKIRTIIIEMIHYEDNLPKIKFSDYLCEKLNFDYTYLSNLFSEVKRVTIKHFIMSHKIERVKELLAYEELTLSEIAWKLHYSSVAHLSNQFKKITGLTPSRFKTMKHKHLLTLESM